MNFRNRRLLVLAVLSTIVVLLLIAGINLLLARPRYVSSVAANYPSEFSNLAYARRYEYIYYDALVSDGQYKLYSGDASTCFNQQDEFSLNAETRWTEMVDPHTLFVHYYNCAYDRRNPLVDYYQQVGTVKIWNFDFAGITNSKEFEAEILARIASGNSEEVQFNVDAILLGALTP